MIQTTWLLDHHSCCPQILTHPPPTLLLLRPCAHEKEQTDFVEVVLKYEVLIGHFTQFFCFNPRTYRFNSFRCCPEAAPMSTFGKVIFCLHHKYSRKIKAAKARNCSTDLLFEEMRLFRPLLYLKKMASQSFPSITLVQNASEVVVAWRTSNVPACDYMLACTDENISTVCARAGESPREQERSWPTGDRVREVGRRVGGVEVQGMGCWRTLESDDKSRYVLQKRCLQF